MSPTTWIQPTLFAAVVTAGSVLAQAASSAASYDTTGTSCNSGASVCMTQNDPPASFAGGNLPNEYAHYVQSTGAITVIGFSIYTQSTTGLTETVQAGVYLENPGVPGTPDVNAAANGMVTAGATPDWATAWLDQPVSIPAGTVFFVSADTNLVEAPDAGAGGATPAGPSYWRRPPFGGTPWSVTGIVQSPIWRIHCAGAVDLPQLSATGVPTVGAPMSVDLSGGPAGATACLGFGASNTMWLSFDLPMDLSGIGATCCWANISCDFTIDTTVGSAGNASVRFDVPNDPRLVGGLFYNQWFIFERGANPLGLISTNYGTGQVGS